MKLIWCTELEYGLTSSLDDFLEECLANNAIATKDWLYELFIQHESNPTVLTAILRTIAHLRYEQVAPHGLSMALLASRHDDTEVRECAIRVCESWETPNCLHLLKNMPCQHEGWLQDYLVEVIKDLTANEIPN